MQGVNPHGHGSVLQPSKDQTRKDRVPYIREEATHGIASSENSAGRTCAARASHLPMLISTSKDSVILPLQVTSRSHTIAAQSRSHPGLHPPQPAANLPEIGFLDSDRHRPPTQVFRLLYSYRNDTRAPVQGRFTVGRRPLARSRTRCLGGKASVRVSNLTDHGAL